MRAGLVSRVVPVDFLIEESLKAAEKIATLSLPISMMVKESINRSFEINLSEGIRFERRLFHASFATQDQKEGMDAFSTKRRPRWKHN